MWIRPAILGAQPSGRGGCASATVGDMCLFIGGTDRSPRAFDEVWILKMAPASPDGVSSSDWRWIRKSTTVRGGGTLPARTGATATAVGRKVYVFGGQEPSRGTCFNDVVVLDCDSWEWSRLEISGPSPPPRNSHVACVVNGGRLLVVYGGSSPEVGPMSDVYLLDLEEGAERWIRPKVTGQAPEPREMHAACVLPNTPGDGDWNGDREIIVVGGRGGASVLSDAVVLDAQRLEWVRRGDVGVAVCAHTAVPWRLGRSGAALLFGGFGGAALRGNDTVTVDGTTLKTIVKGVSSEDAAFAPEPRFAHSSCLVPGGGMLVFAGVTPEADLGDVAVWVPDERASGVVPASDLD